MAIGCQPWVLDSATYVTMLVKQDMVVVGKQTRHYSIVLPKRGGQSRLDEELRGLQRDLLANGILTILELEHHNAGLTEETDKMIQEEAQNCH